MWNNFFKHIDIEPENVNILDGNAADLVAECVSYEKKIKAAGGIELFIGGIGPGNVINLIYSLIKTIRRREIKVNLYEIFCLIQFCEPRWSHCL